MISKSKKIWSWIVRHKILSIIILLVIIVLAWFLLGSKKTIVLETVNVEKGNIKEVVSVTGNVKPLSDVNLAFERGGRVSSLNVSVGDRVYIGDFLASVSNADLQANLDQARANLLKAEAVLGNDSLKADLGLNQSQIVLINSLKDSFTKADDAFHNKIYSLFSDPERYGAHLIFNTDTLLKEEIEKGRNTVSDLFDNWSRNLINLSESSNPELFYLETKNNLNIIKNLLDNCATAVNGLSATAGLSSTQIETWKSTISTGRSNINTAIDVLTTDYNAYKSALLNTQISNKDLLVEKASIDQAKAEVANAEAELAKSIVRSPINGVVTDIPVKLGEIVPANQKALTVISFGDYEVEAFVPEADISKLKIGNLASTTLDAYGAGIDFPTQVIKIDPAATIIDGVPTYKVTLKFASQDSRVRAGMTANLEILTATKEGVMTIPARAVYSNDGDRFVKVLDSAGQAVERKIEIGLRGFDGRVEVVSGLSETEKVVTSL